MKNIIDQRIKDFIDRSVLCWLATSNLDGQPNVSPKEMFYHYKDDYIIIPNIASPNTLKNIKANSKVCLSFVDIFLQKGYQLKGNAEIINKSDAEFGNMAEIFEKVLKGKFPYAQIFKIKVESAKEILAPTYMLYPETSEEDQIEAAKRTYGLS